MTGTLMTKDREAIRRHEEQAGFRLWDSSDNNSSDEHSFAFSVGGIVKGMNVKGMRTKPDFGDDQPLRGLIRAGQIAKTVSE